MIRLSEILTTSNTNEPPAETRRLEHGEEVQIDLAAEPLSDLKRTGRALGIAGLRLATIDAGGKEFHVIDVRQQDTNCAFLVTDDKPSLKNERGFKGVRNGDWITIGRDHYTHRFRYPKTVSKDHFDVTYGSKGLRVINRQPLNDTFVTARFVDVDNLPVFKPVVFADRTKRAADRMQGNPNFGEGDESAPYGYFMNLPILGRYSRRISGGVYLGGSAREAIVVDGRSRLMQEAYEPIDTELRQKFQQNGTLHIDEVMLRIHDRVQKLMKYGDHQVDQISRAHYGDKVVGLSTYLEHGVGVCRHMGPMAAYLIECAIKDGHLPGSVGVERNSIPTKGAHAWAIYRPLNNASEQDRVIDPARGFVGTRSEARRRGVWEYEVPSDDYGPA